MRTWEDPREKPIQVIWDWHGYWRVMSPEGDYGLRRNKDTAVSVAMDAAATGGPATRRIEVYDRDNVLDFVITQTKQKPSPQFFQDDVP